MQNLYLLVFRSNCVVDNILEIAFGNSEISEYMLNIFSINTEIQSINLYVILTYHHFITFQQTLQSPKLFLVALSHQGEHAVQPTQGTENKKVHAYKSIIPINI